MSSNNSSKPRNPLQELPLSTFVRSTSSSLASSSGTSSVGTTPSTVSSLLSSGSQSSAGSRTGSGRIVHLPLSSPNQDGASTRTVRPTIQPPSPSTRRWPISSSRHSRGSSTSLSQTLTPGRLHHSGTITSSPLNPRSSVSATPSAEERRSARQLMMEEVDDPGSMAMDVDGEEEGRTVRARGTGRDRDREMMPPPAVPVSVLEDPTLTPGRSPARRLFTVPNADATPGRPISAGPLQPSPPLPPNRTSETAEKGKTKPRARTSTGRESPCPPPVTDAVVGDSTTCRNPDEEVAKKVRLDGGLSSVAKGKQRMEEEVETTAASTSGSQTEDEEQLARQRLENVDPHNCGFTVWEDMNRAGPSSMGSSSTPRLQSSSTSNIHSDSASSTSMTEKNKKALAWLTIPFDNQENIKPPSTNRIPFVLDTNGKGKPSGPSGSSKSSATSSTTSSGKAASFGAANAVPTAGIATSSRTPATSARSSPVATQNTRNEPSIRSTMRANIAPISTGVAGLRGPECGSPVRASTPAHTLQSGEGSPTPTLKLRRTASSLATSRNNPPARNVTSDVPARPVLVLRRTGSAGNVNTVTTNSTASRTSSDSAHEQENEGFTVSVVAGTKDKSIEEEKVADKCKKTARKKRKSDEMLDSPSDSHSDSVKRPPTRSTATNPSSPLVQTRAQGRRTRRSLGGSTGSEKKSAAGNGKTRSENGYEGRVLRSMTRAGNGL